MDTDALHLDPKTDYSKFEFKTLDANNPEPAPTQNPVPEPTPEPPKPIDPELNASEPPPAPEAKAIADEELIKILGERGISLSKLDDIKAVMEEGVSLKAQVETLSKQELKFANDKQKALYEFASKHNGNELSAAKNFLSAVELDLEKSSPKTTQFEAFALQNPHLTREDAKAIFDEKYEKDYGDGNFEGKKLLQFEHDNATRSARQTIEEVRKSYVEAKLPEPTAPKGPEGPSPEDLVAVKLGIDGALKDFKGASVPLSEYKTKTGHTVPAGAMNVAIKPEEAAKFRGYLENPESFVRDVIGSFKGEKGLNWSAYANEMYQIVNRKEIQNQILAQGIEKGQLLMLEEIKNSGKEKLPEGGKEGGRQKSWTESYESSRKAVN